ncbi:hypothetical protein ACB496_15475 [Lelliottia nimipressuralis]|uniref:hypothetical protein n=1 Tax=Lelliottia nimipressuralis TaxID=69220 RepID=UPI0035577DD0
MQLTTGIKILLVALNTTAIIVPFSFAGAYSGGGDVLARLTIGGEGAVPSVTVGENLGLHPDSRTDTVAFTLTTLDGGTRQGVKITRVCPPGGCAVTATWSLKLSAANTQTDDDGYTFAETGPTTYKALLQTPGPIEPGVYTVKVETVWIY